MPLRIYNNLASLNSQMALTVNSSLLGKSIERIASGERIHKASDDGGGMALAASLGSDIIALQQGSRNLHDSISLVKTAEGGLGEISSMLIRLRELASQSATGTIGQNERGTLQLEYDALAKEIDRISTTTEFSGQKLIDGSLSGTATDHLIIQIGGSAASGDQVDLNASINLTAVTTTGLGIAGTSISSVPNSLTALSALTQAIQNLVTIRGRIGATQNQMAHILDTQNTTVQNLTSAQSTVKDADMAEELAGLTKNQILVQASSAMVGQSNLIPQAVLRLLQQ